MRAVRNRPDPGQRSVWLWGFLAQFALAVPSAAPAQSETGKLLRDQALRFYKQKRYDEACSLYEKLATDAKVDGALWADLGLCEFRRGRDEAGERASLLAVRYGDEAVRKNAYFNLHASGYRERLPEAKPGDEISCDYLPASPPFGCKKLWACVIPWTQYGSGGGIAGTNVLFGWGADAMAAVKAGPTYERPEAAEESNAVPLSSEEEAFCGYCHMHAWACSSSRIVTPKVEQCFRKNTGTTEKTDPNICFRRTPADGKLCDEYMKCYEELCNKAQTAYDSSRAVWPEAADEIARAHDGCKDCGIQQATICEVIAVDPCNGRVGYACQQEARGKKGKLTVSELTVTEQNEEQQAR